MISRVKTQFCVKNKDMKKDASVNRNKKTGKAAAKACAAIALLLLAGMLFAVSAIFRFDKWHRLEPELMTECDAASSFIACDGTLLCALGPVKRIAVDIGALKPVTKNAFIAVEDSRFYEHGGIDVKRVFGAALADLKARRFVQGASTISQQLIKLSHLTNEKTVDRKAEEAVLALELERNYTKDEILEMYLNLVYFGGGYYGIEAAALGYFGVHASELNAAQSAALAGVLKSPSKYAPHIDADACVDRRNTVLRLMREQGYLSETDYRKAINEELTLSPCAVFKSSASAEFAVEEAVRILQIPREDLLRGGYTVETGFDRAILAKARELASNDESFPCKNAQIGIAVIRADGSIAALIGGRGDDDGAGLDRAASIERQPGSLIKPILVYAPALETGGFTAASVLTDEETAFGDYKPRNSGGEYYGPVTMREAVIRSLNVPAVKLLSAIGVDSAVSFAERMGISFEGENTGLPLALGGFTRGVSPLEMAGAYAALSNGGVYIKPASVNRITDRHGRVVYERRVSGERVMTEQNAFILTSMLKDAAEFGTARRLNDTGLELAAKTGTAIDDGGVRDAWCAAYSAEFTAVVWMGTDSAQLGSLPAEAAGGNHPTLLCGELFKHIYKGRSCPGFTIPDGVVEIGTDISEMDKGLVYAARQGEAANNTEFFADGTEPRDENPAKKEPRLPVGFGWSISELGQPVISFIAEEGFDYSIHRILNGEEKEVFEYSGEAGYVSFSDKDNGGKSKANYRLTVSNPDTGETVSGDWIGISINGQT